MASILQQSCRIYGRVQAGLDALKKVRDHGNGKRREKISEEEIQEILSQKPEDICVKFIPDFVVD